MTAYELYQEYKKYHIPIFQYYTESYGYTFCYGEICYQCKAKKLCDSISSSISPTLAQNEINKIKQENPEYFI